MRFRGASARPASTRRCRWLTPRVPRHSDSWRRRDWWSGPSRKTCCHALPRRTPRQCRPRSDLRRADGRQREHQQTHATMRVGFSCELPQETHIALVEQLNLFDFVLQNCDALHAHTEGEAGDLRRVVAAVFHELKDIRIDHAAAQQFDPAAVLALPAAFAAAEDAAHLHVGAGLGEREERRIEARLHRRAEQRLHGVIEGTLQIAEGNVLVDRQPFHLMEDWRVRRIQWIVAVYLAWDDDAHWRLLLLHGADLHRRGVRAQQQTITRRLLFLSGDE